MFFKIPRKYRTNVILGTHSVHALLEDRDDMFHLYYMRSTTCQPHNITYFNHNQHILIYNNFHSFINLIIRVIISTLQSFLSDFHKLLKRTLQYFMKIWKNYSIVYWSDIWLACTEEYCYVTQSRLVYWQKWLKQKILVFIWSKQQPWHRCTWNDIWYVVQFVHLYRLR